MELTSTLEDTSATASDRRAHPRVPNSELGEAPLVRIPGYGSVTLVDLSIGGALLELPKALPPDSRFMIELATSSQEVAAEFRMIRCYVAELKGGVRYHAAGAFDRALSIAAALARRGTSAGSHRLVPVIEALLGQSSNVKTRGADFYDILAWVARLLKDSQSEARVSTDLKLQVRGLFPSLTITPASTSLLPGNALRSARFFGLDFRSADLLTTTDRGFLRAIAQLIALLDIDADDSGADDADSPLIIHGLADWQALSRDAQPWDHKR